MAGSNAPRNADILDRIANILENLAQGDFGHLYPVFIAGLAGLAEFRKADPPKFEGGYNPEGARSWLQEMEEILETKPCSDSRRVMYAVFMLVGDAEEWWKNTRQSLQAERRNISWALFKEEFVHRYLPEEVHCKEINRTHGDAIKTGEAEMKRARMTSEEYGPVRDKGKTPSCRFGPYRTQNSSEAIGMRLSVGGYTPIGKIAPRNCEMCGRYHGGICRGFRKKRLCFACKQSGHYVADCPNRDPRKEIMDGETGAFEETQMGKKTKVYSMSEERTAMVGEHAKCMFDIY